METITLTRKEWDAIYALIRATTASLMQWVALGYKDKPVVQQLKDALQALSESLRENQP